MHCVKQAYGELENRRHDPRVQIILHDPTDQHQKQCELTDSLAADVRREKDGMLAMLQSRLELSAPCADSGALVALPWHGDSNGADQQEDLAAAYAAACRRVVDLEGAMNSLEVATVC